jgi:hypothetical protein
MVMPLPGSPLIARQTVKPSMSGGLTRGRPVRDGAQPISATLLGRSAPSVHESLPKREHGYSSAVVIINHQQRGPAGRDDADQRTRLWNRLTPRCLTTAHITGVRRARAIVRFADITRCLAHARAKTRGFEGGPERTRI